MRWSCLVTVMLALGSCEKQAESWATSDYLAAGVPDPGHAWSVAELIKATEAIGQAATSHAERLPRYRDPRSGQVFARLIESPPDDLAASVTTRIGAHLQRFETLNTAAKLYANGLVGVPPREQLELFSTLLHEAVAASSLVEPFLATFPADDPSLQVRRDGLSQFRDGLGEAMLGSLMIADDKRVADADRLMVFRYLADTIPALFPSFPAARQQAIRTYATNLVTGTSGDLHDAAVRVQRAIELTH